MSHTRKKPFAPSSQNHTIKSYFPPSSTSSHASASTSLSAPPSSDPISLSDTSARLLPALPTQIQSSLLNVGMRVRKSVPEGYKTHKTLPPSLLHSSSQPAPLGGNARRRGWDGEGAQMGMRTGGDMGRRVGGDEEMFGPSTAPPTLMRSVSDRSRELQPFCGLNSVGGLDGTGQTVEVPGLGWSQSTVSSNGTDGGERRKRGLEFEEEVEAELDEFFEDGEGSGEGSGEEEMGDREVQVRGRRILPLKGRRGAGGGFGMIGKDARDAGVRVVGDFDDGDVAFLQPMDVDA
ncbi:S-phase delaying protein 1 [Elsinoe australis]|uniref:S-phase delaying protein 1 n=1 Tax=Elsinoe australis TaxID=40998 RepID=A0A2P8A064_9PEZI|nr:S-phase delaying protein 1 [Elsinoe australis]